MFYYYLAIAISLLFLLGHLWPSYPAKPPTYSAPPDSKGWAVLSTMPDLRVSEFAPDLDAIPSDRERRETEFAKNNELARLAYQRSVTKGFEDYYDKIAEIRTRRWKEGNPVTKKNPIDPDEMPPRPSNFF